MLQADPPALVSSIWNNDNGPSRQYIEGGSFAWFWVLANSQTQSVPEYQMIHAIATYVGEVVISKYNLACDNTSMHAGSVIVAHLIKLLLQLNKQNAMLAIATL